ncbi:hypothetical protein EU537_02985 [Candidatus Thorarchaeota archaeon]|nr:MAG: hypothetical protein EU537_02985 [Candidatus Thorarchaeota archaeon]
MTFLIDPFLLIGLTILSMRMGQKAKPQDPRRIGKLLSLFSLVVIIFTSTSLYNNGWWMDWFWIPLQPYATSGKDLMINSGIFAFESQNTQGLIDFLAYLQIALYPLWSFVGYSLYQRFMNRNSRR